ncbi:MAG TPA: amidohydrolase [Solirubrobacterales bacterium]|nr:amidohydrolase [Solirubrobacterales bacterium]
MSLTVVNATLDGERTRIRVEDGTIAKLGPRLRARDGDEVIDADGMAIVPGLVNGHTHAAMTLFRGHGDDLPLMRWLQDVIWPVEARLDDDDVYWGTRLACLEMIRTGTIRFWDMYWRPAATARAVEDAGIRATISAPLFDVGDAAGGESIPDMANRSLEEIGDPRDLVAPALGPHAIYTVSEGALRWIAEASEERQLPVNIHLSETEDEVVRCVQEHGVRPAEYLDRLGLLGPRTLVAHGVWLDESELALVAERGTTVVTNPVANLKLAVGRIFPYRAARRHGIPVGLGTDGAGSNNSLDVLQDLKVLALLQKHEARDPSVLPAEEAWRIATGRMAPLLDVSGRIAEGERADFLLVRGDSPELGLGNFTADLVYAASGSVVDTTVVNGRVLMRGGVVEGADEVLAKARERCARLGLEG